MQLFNSAEEYHEHRQNHLDKCCPTCIVTVVDDPDEVRIVADRVGCSNEEENQEEKEVAMISVSDAIACKHAMMISLQDADTADIAVPGSRWNNQFALCT